MSFLTSPFKAYVRWRHSRGFGVHSPFAYDLVKMAVRPGGAYSFYGYDDIDRIVYGAGFKGYPGARRNARLLLRLLVQLQPHRLLLPEGLPAMKVAAGAAGVACLTYSSSSELPAPQPGDMLVAVTDNIPGGEIARRINNDTVLLALLPPGDEVEAVYEACRDHKGLILHGVRLLLAVPRKEMAFVAYTMNF